MTQERFAVGELELMRLHIDALYTHDVRGRLVHVNEPGDTPAPRAFLGRTTQGHVLRVTKRRCRCARCQTGGVDRAGTAKRPLAQRPHCGDAIEALLSRDAPIQRVWTGPAYCVDASALAEPVHTVRVTPHERRCCGRFRTGATKCAFASRSWWRWKPARAVALCCSVRITPAAHAAGVETLPDSRGRGYAARVVTAWAREVAILGAVPLYSTSSDNVASQGVARRLGMHRIGIDYHVT